MYHVISTSFTAILLYLISYSFYRIGYFSIQYHRRFWNILLAAAFIITALAGIFLALQINYKWNIPFIKTVLKWHVEFGIGMAITGLFHFIWHLEYYFKLFSKSKGHAGKQESQKFPSSAIKNNLFIVAVSYTHLRAHETDSYL